MDIDSEPSLPRKRTPERGTINDDGSINLGMSRRPGQPLTIEPRPAVQSSVSSTMIPSRQTPPLSSTSDLSAYRQQALRPGPPSHSLSDDNRLAPMNSMSSVFNNRQPSLSPDSQLSSNRKRSFSTTENESYHSTEPGIHEGGKRLSSIKSLLNPQSAAERNPMAIEDHGDRWLPPLRSPAATVHSAPSPGSVSSRSHTPSTFTSVNKNAALESEKLKADRRAALQREAEKMREMLAAKERELLELGEA